MDMEKMVESLGIDQDQAKELLENSFIEDIGLSNLEKSKLSDKIKFNTTNTMKFAVSEEAINTPKDKDGAFDIIPTIMPNTGGGADDWVKINYAGAIDIKVNDFYDMKKSLTYDKGGTM